MALTGPTSTTLIGEVTTVNSILTSLIPDGIWLEIYLVSRMIWTINKIDKCAAERYLGSQSYYSQVNSTIWQQC